MDIRKDILWRVYLGFIVMAVTGVAILGRAFYIQRIQGKYWIDMGNSSHLVYKPIVAERGTIYSEDGNMLSTSVPVFDVFIDFGAEGLREKEGKRFKDNIDSLSLMLAGLFKDKTAADYKKELQKAYKNTERYYPFKKKISFDEYRQLRNFPLVRQGRNRSGFMIDTRDKRINPYVLFANRTIGLSRGDSTKNVGLERTYDSYLRGVSGQRLMRYVSGAYLPVENAIIEPENGNDIITTLDSYIQDVTENALYKMVAGNNSLHGTAIVMETSTGKIKAIANLGKQPDGAYAEDLNYGIGKATEPGSVFKLATLLSLIDDGYVNSNSKVNCEGGVKNFYGLRIKDAHLGMGEVTVNEAFARSSNVAFAKLADQYYHEQPSKFIKHLSKLRLDTLTGIDIVASAGRPLIKKPGKSYWSNTTIPYMAHGYEELVTPLHMLMVYNAVANNGKMMKPYLVNSIKNYGIDVKTFEPEVLVKKICKDETLKQLQECLLAVVENKHGTAHKVVFDSIYSIAGKTGTAVTALNNRGYNKGNKIYQASFMGYFPANAPKYSIAVVIQNSSQSKLIYGADVSGVVFKEISDRIYHRFLSTLQYKAPMNKDSANYKYIAKKNDAEVLNRTFNLSVTDSTSGAGWHSVNIKNNAAFLKKGAVEKGKNIAPDVSGMGLKDAVYVLQENEFVITVTGRGRVFSQSVAPGTAYKKGQKITLVLN